MGSVNLSHAVTAEDILAGVTDSLWRKGHRTGEPETPTLDALAEFVANEPPEDAVSEANKRLRAIFPEAATFLDKFTAHIMPRRVADMIRTYGIEWIAPANARGEPIPYRLGVSLPHDSVTRYSNAVAWPTRSVPLLDVHAAWVQARLDGSTIRHPLAPIIEAWLNRARPMSTSRLIVSTEKRPAKGKDPARLARLPGRLALSVGLGGILEPVPSLDAVLVDGEPLASTAPDRKVKRYRVAKPPPDLFGGLLPGPRTLDGRATAGLLVEAAAGTALTGDERSPLRVDLLRLGSMAFALTRPMHLSDSEGALLVSGRDTGPARRRFNQAMWGLRMLAIEGAPGIRWAVVDAEPGPGSNNRIGPPSWWIRGGSGMSHRLSGSLFRLATRDGAVERTIAGIEGALLWGPSAGKGKGGRLPDAVRPERRGGPGPSVRIPWWQVLRLAGENVPRDADWKRSGTEIVRYNRRVDALQRARYFAPNAGRGESVAGDTVEIVRRQRAGRGGPAGLIVRFTARGCAVYTDPVRERIPAAVLFKD